MWLLILLASTMIVVALSGLYLISERSDQFDTPGRHTEVWQSYSLQLQLRELLETAQALEHGEASPAQLKIRLGTVRTALDPLLRTRVFDYLVEPRPDAMRTLARLDRRTADWMQRLDWRDPVKAAEIASRMRKTLPDEIRASHELIVACNVAVAIQLDRERQSLKQTFHWLGGFLALIATGCLVLALRILSAQRRSRRLASELHRLNSSLERRVQSRTRLLHERETLLQTILDSTPSEVTLISADQRRVFYVSHTLLMQSGAGRQEAFDLSRLFVDADDYQRLLARLDRGDTVQQLETRLYPAAPYWALLTARPLRIHGQPAWLIWSFDITRRKTMEQKLHRLATTDSLTGLYNRRALLRAAIQALREDRRAPLSLLLLDIDHFKRINDAHGHPIGDDVLKTLARRMSSWLRAGTLIGRIGGEEFAIVLPHTQAAEALAIAERLRQAVASAPVALSGQLTLSITLSIGITQRQDGDSLRTLVQRADHALYRAKAEGRNRSHLTEAPRQPAAAADI
ncbi:GGDEF domain-containing protein [Salinicola rhizosphaerae]|uniref:diguanylate cyclase n=1 Tax=Salinicola rhizosphaerae TaxID=1443141 RepID=A0ABQ3DY18_9GAMM|nr:sensor domain-containing diguanylate cyclase [Salinicola rhizosphaerae]GHB19339.1 GGDEF domain-containing protein [Salinicola rhizosphaerae]